jgi:hypothetical protein
MFTYRLEYAKIDKQKGGGVKYNSLWLVEETLKMLKSYVFSIFMLKSMLIVTFQPSIVTYINNVFSKFMLKSMLIVTFQLSIVTYIYAIHLNYYYIIFNVSRATGFGTWLVFL